MAAIWPHPECKDERREERVQVAVSHVRTLQLNWLSTVEVAFVLAIWWALRAILLQKGVSFAFAAASLMPT